MTDSTTYISAVQHWLEEIVIALNLCPFAKAPWRKNRIHFELVLSDDPETLISALEQQLQALNNIDADKRETTLVITPNMLTSFDDYLNYLDLAQWSLKQWGLAKEYQIASFHPQYCFADQHENDVENYTNRAPYPIFHLLRQQSLNRALRHYTNAENIPLDNMNTLRALNSSDFQRLFAYLAS